jgi:hypothetical protein
MKTPAIIATLALAGIGSAQVHSAFQLDLKDGTISPIVGYTIRAFEPFNVGKFEFTPEVWGLGEIVINNGQKPTYSAGFALVAGTKITTGIDAYVGISGKVDAVTGKVKVSPIASIAFKL